MPGPTALMRETRLTVSNTYAWNADNSTIATAAGVTKRVAFTDFKLGAQTEKLDIGAEFGGMGTQSHYAANVRDNLVRVNPSLRGVWTVDEWLYMLGWIFGSQSGSGPYSFALAAPGLRRNLIFDTTYDVWNLVGCQVSRFTLTATAGGPVEAEVEMSGITFDKVTSFPASPTALTFTKRFLMGDQAVTATGFSGTIQPRSLRAVFDFGTNGERFDGSFVSGGAVNRDRRVSLELVLRSYQHAALWPLAAADGGVPMTLTFTAAGTNSNLSLAFSFPAVVAAVPPPEVADPELYSTFQGNCLVAAGGAANSEATCTLDPTD